jgi:hypothetical protein
LVSASGEGERAACIEKSFARISESHLSFEFTSKQISKYGIFPLCYACRTSTGKFVMRALTRFAFTSAQLLVGGYMFGVCILVAHAQAPKPLYTPGPPVPTAPGSNVPPPVPTTPESSSPPTENEPRSAARTHERTSVAKRVHRRGRPIVAARTPPSYWRSYWDPSGALVFCPVWNYPYEADRCDWRWVGGVSGP